MPVLPAEARRSASRPSLCSPTIRSFSGGSAGCWARIRAARWRRSPAGAAKPRGATGRIAIHQPQSLRPGRNPLPWAILAMGYNLGPRVIPRIPGYTLSPRVVLRIPRYSLSPQVVPRIAGYNLSPRVALEIPGPTDFSDPVPGAHIRRVRCRQLRKITRGRCIASVHNVRRSEGSKRAPSRDPQIRRSRRRQLRKITRGRCIASVGDV